MDLDYIDTIAASEQINNTFNEIDTLFKEYDLLDSTLDEALRLNEVIENHGVSKGLIEYADPHGYFQTYIPNFPVLESLNTQYVKGEVSMSIGSKIKDVAKKILDAIKKVFKKIIETFQKIGSTIKNFIIPTNKTAEGINKILKETQKADDYFRKGLAKQEAKTIKMVDKDNIFDTIDSIIMALSIETQLKNSIVKGSSEFIKELDNDNIKKGLNIQIDNGQLVELKEVSKKEEKTLVQHGLDVKWAIDSTDKIGEIANLPKLIDGMRATIRKVESDLEKEAMDASRKADDPKATLELKANYKDGVDRVRTATKFTNILAKETKAVSSEIIKGAKAVQNTIKEGQKTEDE